MKDFTLADLAAMFMLLVVGLGITALAFYVVWCACLEQPIFFVILVIIGLSTLSIVHLDERGLL